MRRKETGRYQITNYSGEQVRAYIPAPLPPSPPVVIDGPLQQSLEAASLALGRLDSLSDLLPNPALFIIASLTDISKMTGLAFPGASSGMNLLVELEIAREITGQPRNRLFSYRRYIEILSEGTEPI